MELPWDTGRLTYLLRKGCSHRLYRSIISHQDAKRAVKSSQDLLTGYELYHELPGLYRGLVYMYDITLFSAIFTDRLENLKSFFLKICDAELKFKHYSSSFFNLLELLDYKLPQNWNLFHE